ncbi:MAG: GIY-YIG nuclease family protein [bacterium]
MTIVDSPRVSGPAAYVLVLFCANRRTLRVGALGELEFQPGYYLYVGSGGANVLKRIERHLRPRKIRRWQVDWLTSGPGRLRPAEACILPGLRECAVARSLGRSLEPAHRLGASDCRCITHLYNSRNAAQVRRVLKDLVRRAGQRVITSRSV